METNTVTSYKDLVKIFRSQEKRNVIYIKNVEISFELDLHQLFEDAGLYIGAEGSDLENQSFRLTIKNVRCKSLLATELISDKIIMEFQIKDSSIGDLWINSCHFHSLELINTSIKSFDIKNSHIDGETSLWFARNQKLDAIKLNIEDTYFGGNLKISNIVLNNESEINIIGSQSIITKDCIISDTFVLGGLIDIRCEILHDLRFNFINYQGEDDYYNNPLNYGKLVLYDVIVKNELVFLNCHIGELGIENAEIKGISEHVFTYNKLQYGAAVALRNGAIKKNDVILSEKYTAEIYDALLHENSVKAYRRWASHLEGKSFKRRFGLRDIFYKYILEPIDLFIPSFTSSEGLLLWLNKYSNDYNRSWIRGIIFTLIITLFSYVFLNYLGMERPFFVFDLKFNGFGEVVKGYLSLLDIFNLTKISDKISYNLTPCGYFILFVAKVLITYGFWQTIYAFFRYRK